MRQEKSKSRKNVVFVLIALIAIGHLLIGCTTIKSNYKVIASEKFDLNEMDNYRIDKYSDKGIRVFRFDIFSFSRNETPQDIGPVSLSKRALDKVEGNNGVALLDVEYKYQSLGILSPYFLSFGYARITADKALLKD